MEIQDIKKDFDKITNKLSKITIFIETLWDESRAKPDNITINGDLWFNGEKLINKIRRTASDIDILMKDLSKRIVSSVSLRKISGLSNRFVSFIQVMTEFNSGEGENYHAAVKKIVEIFLLRLLLPPFLPVLLQLLVGLFFLFLLLPSLQHC